MDSITHAFLGAVAVNLGLRQKIGRDASWAAAIAAMLPDLDILAVPALTLAGVQLDAMAAERFHRNITHSLPIMPLYAFAVAGIWWLIRWRVLSKSTDSPEQEPINLEDHVVSRPCKTCRAGINFWWLYGAVAISVLTHALPDWCTSYGTQLFAPFTNRRFSCDSVAIVDFIYTPLLIMTLAVIYLVRRLTHGVARKATIIIALVGTVLSTGYFYLGRQMHNVAVDRAVAIARQREIILPSEKGLRADAYPTIGTVFIWRAVLETDRLWAASRINVFNTDNTTVPMNVAAKVDNIWVRRALELPEAKTFQWFAMDRLRASYQPDGSNHVVQLYDMRYGTKTDDLESLWSYRVVFDESGKVLEAGRRNQRFRLGYK